MDVGGATFSAAENNRGSFRRRANGRQRGSRFRRRGSFQPHLQSDRNENGLNVSHDQTTPNVHSVMPPQEPSRRNFRRRGYFNHRSKHQAVPGSSKRSGISMNAAGIKAKDDIDESHDASDLCLRGMLFRKFVDLRMK